VALEHAVTRSIAEAATSRKILQAVMRVICESERWETAGYFRVEDPQGTTRLIAGWSGPGMAEAAIDYYKKTTDKVIPPGGLLSGSSQRIFPLLPSKATMRRLVSPPNTTPPAVATSELDQ